MFIHLRPPFNYSHLIALAWLWHSSICPSSCSSCSSLSLSFFFALVLLILFDWIFCFLFSFLLFVFRDLYVGGWLVFPLFLTPTTHPSAALLRSVQFGRFCSTHLDFGFDSFDFGCHLMLHFMHLPLLHFGFVFQHSFLLLLSLSRFLCISNRKRSIFHNHN